MKRIYFAGKFRLDPDHSLPLDQRLRNDFRAKILGDPKRMTRAQEDVKLDSGHIYNGPFYCEQASNGDFTSTDCTVVRNSEYQAVRSCDVFAAVFDRQYAVGTVVELGWAIEMKKEIILFYREERSSYTIQSDYWFAIADALARSDKVKVFPFHSIREVVKAMHEGTVFEAD